VTWGSDTTDALLFPDDSAEPVPNPAVEFGDPTPLVDPSTATTVTTTATSPVGGI